MAKAATAKRELSLRRMSEIHEEAVKAELDPQARAFFLACYPSVADVARDFETAHLKIIQDAATEFDAEDKVRARFDRLHYRVKAVYHTLNVASASGAGDAGSRASMVRLPKISLPQFTGEISLWPSFIALFNSSIHSNPQLTDIERYQYLLASLRGDALGIIKNLPLTQEHYAIAYDTLVSRYQNRRRLATHYWHSIANARPLKVESADALRKLLDEVNENLRALQMMDFPTDAWDFILFNTLLDKLTPSLRERFEAEHRKSEIPTFKQLTNFLHEYCRVFASLSASSPTGKARDKSAKGSAVNASVSAFVANSTPCSLCGESHLLTKCSSFLKLSEKDRYSRARDLGLCLNCLHPGHRVNNCPSSWSCRKCSQKHHSLIHFASGPTPGDPTGSSSAAPLSAAESSAAAEPAIVSMSSTSRAATAVLLSTIRAEMVDAHGRLFPVRILLDSASQSNFITEACLLRSGLTRARCQSVVLGLSDARAATARGRTSMVLRACGRDDLRLPVEATVLAKISSPLPHAKIDCPLWPHIRGLPLADPGYSEPGRIDILLGAEAFVSVLREGHLKGRAGEPDALNTMFGWVLMGAVSSQDAQPVHSFVSTSLDGIDAAVRRFWALEDIPDSPALSTEDIQCERTFQTTTHRDSSGRFVVFYPFAGDLPCFTDSRQIAVSRFHSLERRFKKDASFKEQYCQFMRDYLDCGHMELVEQPFPADGRVYYLPHHGVSKIESETTKLRVVFDASTQCTNGLSLNQTMLSGPKLQQDIMTILVRFRLGAIALTADVKQMFRQIQIDPSQRDYQRIVWRFSEHLPLRDYRLTTVTFGVTPSPYLAIRCLMRLAEEGRESHPLASSLLKSSLYVDDIVTSVDTLQEAHSLKEQLVDLLRGAGFVLRKWASSHSAVISDLEPAHCSNAMLTFLDPHEDGFLKVLGLQWHARSDTFGFHVQPLRRDCTKRVILSEVARIFDPLGFLAPITFAAKVLVQQLWSLGLDWDDQPPPDICRQWNRYQRELTELASLRIPRPVVHNEVIRRELHGFCDASERGYGAVVYLRIVATDSVHIYLLAAKSRVAPLKSVTIPRLELCAALLLADLLRYLATVLKGTFTLDAIYAWSDSMVTLSWLRSSPHNLETFVRNRVAKIQSHSDITAWNHVGTKSNPADHCSRGLFPQELTDCRLWWAGPEWLSNSAPTYDVDPVLRMSDVPSLAFVITPSPIRDDSCVDMLLARHSSLDRACRILAYVLRFTFQSRRRGNYTSLTIDQEEAHAALLRIVRVVQSDQFAIDIANLLQGRTVSKELRQLSPFLDPSGVLRVGGRIAHANLPYETRHPALIPNKHRLTELLVERTHQQHLHPGRRALQYLLSQHFWVLGAQRAIKRVLSRCYRCFRANPRPVQPFMAELPASRVQPTKPFSISGVDFAGPFSITPRRTRGAKAFKIYVCVFVCFAVKAIHLEAVHSLSTDSFLAALRRFIARRGRCSLLCSDRGTNFVGARRELLKHMEQASAAERIKWSFNPPSAPHFGGLWEAGVKAFKTHLARVVGAQVLSLEEFSTLLAQVEAVLNSRPLCPLSGDPNDLAVLSPGHFLTTEPLVSLPGPSLGDVPAGRLDRWQMLQRMHQDFWKRWSAEYLHCLQQRPKWLRDSGALSIDSLVLIKEANAMPLHWQKGRVVALHPGKDGIARVATVRTASGVLTRPLVKLCPLPMGRPAGTF